MSDFSFHCISYLAIEIETASVGNDSGLNFIREYTRLSHMSICYIIFLAVLIIK
jgi:Ni,Fe-hydrogenase I cytochrome b subunit